MSSIKIHNKSTDTFTELTSNNTSSNVTLNLPEINGNIATTTDIDNKIDDLTKPNGTDLIVNVGPNQDIKTIEEGLAKARQLIVKNYSLDLYNITTVGVVLEEGMIIDRPINISGNNDGIYITSNNKKVYVDVSKFNTTYANCSLIPIFYMYRTTMRFTGLNIETKNTMSRTDGVGYCLFFWRSASNGEVTNSTFNAISPYFSCFNYVYEASNVFEWANNIIQGSTDNKIVFRLSVANSASSIRGGLSTITISETKVECRIVGAFRDSQACYPAMTVKNMRLGYLSEADSCSCISPDFTSSSTISNSVKLSTVVEKGLDPTQNTLQMLYYSGTRF